MAPSPKGGKGPSAPPTPAPTNTFKYGMPVYGVLWPKGKTFLLCGGGGGTATGIKNRLVLANCERCLLTDQVGEFDFGMDCPMRMAVNPDGNHVVFAMGKGGIKGLNVDMADETPKTSELSASLQDKVSRIKGDVKCLAFSPSGNLLGLGFSDGSLKVVEWPSMEVKLDVSGEDKLKDSVRDIDFSQSNNSHAVAVVLDNGTCEVWDWQKQTPLAKVGLTRGQYKSDASFTVSSPNKVVLQQLPKVLHGARFSSTKYARDGSGNLHSLVNTREGCYVVTWALAPLGGLSILACTRASKQPGANFAVSADNSKLAVGTSEAAVVVLLSQPLSVIRTVHKAHMVFTTGITFSEDAKHVLSVSADASAFVTEATKEPTNWSRLIILFILFVAVLVLLWLQTTRMARDSNHQEL